MNNYINLFINYVIRKLKISISEEKKNNLVQFIGFCLIGLSNTVLAYMIYTLIVFTMNKFQIIPSYDYYFGNIISWILSVAWSFYWNNRLVFYNNERKGIKIFIALIKCYVSYAISGLIITNLLSFLWIEVLEINKYLAPIINLIITIPLNFLLNKLWAFKGKTNEEN